MARSEKSPAVTKVLVANRGEIARRVFASCRRMGIATVAVHSDADADAPFVADADEAVPLGGNTPGESYLDQRKVLDAAGRAGADAVHPGYGFLAENASFARAVGDAGLTWIGPPPEAIEAMGSKVRARELMEEAGVPVLPGVTLDGVADGLADAADGVGFPLLAKASAGGGGKGMRVVDSPADLESAVAAAAREAESAFGDGTIFLERYLERPRHVEIQVFADSRGSTVSLGERECSIQRRHQKVVEESPSPAVDAELRRRMGEAAVRAAEAVGYVGAGTVEFLLADDGEFFFLEMNTRLQVEHPVTELVTGLDLVRLQLMVARGAELPAEAREPRLDGHAIEVRLYAEDAANDFLPQTGTIERIRVPGSERFAVPAGDGRPPIAIRLDSGVEDGTPVSPFYDPMLAKVVAWAPTREEAAERLAAALAASEVHGSITNRDFLVRVLRDPGFLAGDTDTGFLGRREGLGEPLAGPEAERLAAVAAALCAASERRAEAFEGGVWGFAPANFRNVFSERQRVLFEGSGEEPLEVAYALRRSGWEASVAGEELEGLSVWALAPDEIDLEVGGVRRRLRVHRTGDPDRGERLVHHVNGPLGQSSLAEVPRYATGAEAAGEGAMIAPMPGKVLRVAVAEGAEVAEGEIVILLEAMKMEHELTAPVAGTLASVAVAEGDQVEPGALLAEVEPAQ